MAVFLMPLPVYLCVVVHVVGMGVSVGCGVFVGCASCVACVSCATCVAVVAPTCVAVASIVGVALADVVVLLSTPLPADVIPFTAPLQIAHPKKRTRTITSHTSHVGVP